MMFGTRYTILLLTGLLVVLALLAGPSLAATETFEAVADALISEDAPSTNYGNSATVCGADGDDPKNSGRDISTLFRWDVSAISAESVVETVLITLKITGKGDPGTPYELYEIKQPWVEMETTWNDYAAGNSWEIGGAKGSEDRGTAVLGELEPTVTGFYTIDLNAAGLALVQSWIVSPTTNYGLIIADSANTNGLDWDCRERGVAANRPQLTVQYVSGGGPTNTPTYTPTPTPTPTVTTTSIPSQLVSVFPSIETTPVPFSGDVADDPAIWVHPTDAALSLIIGTNKNTNGGLHLYNLDGTEHQFVQDGALNNVDIRGGFPLGTESVSLVTAANRNNNGIAAYIVNPVSRRLEGRNTCLLQVSINVYGSCMYHSPVSDKYYVFVNSKTGEVEQWELFNDGVGRVTGALARSFDVGGQVEGCVADDELGYFYISEEDVGIWKYSAEPGDGPTRVQVDVTGSGGHLVADVEGLTIYYAANETGYLIASSQGEDDPGNPLANTFAVYERGGDNVYVGSFEIVAGNGIDGATGTDGIDVISAALGTAFPNGVFVAHDGDNSPDNQNFKLVPWETIANAFDPSLIID